MPGYPIELDLRGRRVLVVGLGAVGRRKASGLAAAGARVVAVDPGVASALELPGAIEVRREPYGAAHLEGMTLAFAAAPAEVNRRVVADARRAGVWVCSASDPRAGDFTVPAVWREGPLTLTVDTAGASPALAVALRDRAARALGPAAAGLAALLVALRPEVFARVKTRAARRRLLAGWADPRWLDLWTSAGPEAVRQALVRALEDAAEPAPPGASETTRPCQETDPP
jgi:siroheme synthase-like protein